MKHFKNISLSSIMEKLTVILLVISFFMNTNVLLLVQASINIIKDPTVTYVDGSQQLETIELTYLREKNLKVYLKPDNTLEYVYYNQDIHYFDGFSYKEIENALESDGNYYKNINHDYEVRFPKTINANSQIELTFLTHLIKWKFEGLTQTNATVNNDGLANIKYIESLNGAHIEYFVGSSTLKENIILDEYIEDFSFSFIMDIGNLELIQDNTISLMDETGRTIYEINPFYMYDNRGQVSFAITVDVTPVSGNSYKFTITPSDEWLNSEVQYPVTIDPIIEIVNDDYNFSYEAKTYLGDLDTYTCYTNTVLVGLPYWEPHGVYSIMKLIKPNHGVDFTNAKITLSAGGYSYGEGMYAIYRLGDSHNFNTINGAHLPTNDYTYLGGSYYSNPILEIPYSSVFTENKNTSILYFRPFWGEGQIEFACNNAPEPVIRISNVVSHFPNVNFHNVDNGNAGTARINLATGELLYQFIDSSLRHNNHPWDIRHNFKSLFANVNTPYGKGWTISYHETLEQVNNNYILTQGDGSKIAFIPCGDEGKYTSVDGFGYNLIVDLNESDVYQLFMSGQVKIFEYLDQSSILYLTKIKNDIESSIGVTINYNDTLYGEAISSIIDGAGNRAVFTYDETTGVLNNISIYKLDFESPTNLKINEETLEYVLNYVYDDALRLTSVNKEYRGDDLYPTSVNIEYNDYTGFIDYAYFGNSEVQEIGKKFTYNSSAQGIEEKIKVKSYRSYLLGSTKSDVTSFEYGINKIKVVNPDMSYQRYWFDLYGNIIKADDNLSNVIYYKYEATPTNQHNLVDIIPVNQSYINHVINPSFKYTDGWYNNISGGVGSITKLNSDIILGNKKIQINRTNSGGTLNYAQTIFLKSGKYILSTSIKNNELNGGAYLDVEAKVAGQSSSLKVITKSLKVVNTNNQYKNYYVEFELTENMQVEISLQNNSIGNAYFDYVDLNQTQKISNHNLIENASFERNTSDTSASHWEGNYFIDTIIPNKVFGQYKAVVFNTDAMYQEVYTTGFKGDRFDFNVWYEGMGHAYVPNAYTEFILEFGYSDYSTEQFVFRSKYNYENSEYDFYIDSLTKTIYAKKNYSYIVVIVKTHGNDVSFVDNISLTKTNSQVVELENLINELPSVITQENYVQVYSVKAKFDLLSIEEQDLVSNKSALLLKVEEASAFESEELVEEEDEEPTNQDDIYGYYDQYIVKQIDDLLREINYTYNTVNGNITSITDPKDNITEYLYDMFDQLLEIKKSVTINGTLEQAQINYEYDVLGRLVKIETNTSTYDISYTSQGNIEEIKVNNQSLIQLEYVTSFGVELSTPSKCTYGNGYTIENEYDVIGKVIKTKYNGNVKYEYLYDSNDNLIQVDDVLENISYFYHYDEQNKIEYASDSTGNIVQFIYSDQGLIEKEYQVFDNNKSVKYIYLEDGSVSENFGNFNVNTNYNDTQDSVTIIIDSLHLRSTKELSNVLVSSIKYSNDEDGLIVTKEIRYTYDEIDNIAEQVMITYDQGIISAVTIDHYEYNELSELTRHKVLKGSTLDETSMQLILDVKYTYDVSGNITEIERLTKLDEYEYLEAYVKYNYNASWSDLLTSVMIKTSKEGTIIDVYTYQYDAIGNVTQIYKNGLDYQSFTFEGRQLRVYEDSTQRIEFYYNYENIRYLKEISLYDELLECFVLDKTIRYYLEDNKVISEQIVDSDGTQTLFYYYDVNGNHIGFEYIDDDSVNQEYFYQLNLQDDVISILDIDGDEVVSYTYDAYGRLINMVGDSEIGELNSIRYRSYYYDNETELYYCNSRYYDVSLYRWINSDESVFVLLASDSILGCNIYSYCENNPVNNIDPDGNLKLNSKMSILIGFAGIIMVAKSTLGGVKGFFKLTDKNKLATILCSAIMILPMTAAVQMLLYYVENWISVFVAAIVAINTAIMVGSALTGGLAQIIIGVGEFVLGCYLPNIITSVNMIINGFKGHSYDMKIGFLTSKYKLV